MACARHSQGAGQWQRVEAVAAPLRPHPPESVRPVRVRGRHGAAHTFWALTQTVRLKRYGRQRLVLVPETVALTDPPRFLLPDALPWESGRVRETWSSRWASESLHEFGKQGTGLEAAQGRKAEAVTRHFRWSCLAQSRLQRAPVSPSEAERCAFAHGAITVGQQARAIAREALEGL